MLDKRQSSWIARGILFGIREVKRLRMGARLCSIFPQSQMCREANQSGWEPVLAVFTAYIILEGGLFWQIALGAAFVLTLIRKCVAWRKVSLLLQENEIDDFDSEDLDFDPEDSEFIDSTLDQMADEIVLRLDKRLSGLSKDSVTVSKPL